MWSRPLSRSFSRALSRRYASSTSTSPSTSTSKLNKISSRITQPKSQGASQAMLYGVGLTEQDMNKAQVGISAMWYEGNPCNAHLRALGDAVKAGVQKAGLVGLQFNTIGVSDGACW